MWVRGPPGRAPRRGHRGRLHPRGARRGAQAGNVLQETRRKIVVFNRWNRMKKWDMFHCKKIPPTQAQHLWVSLVPQNWFPPNASDVSRAWAVWVWPGHPARGLPALHPVSERSNIKMFDCIVSSEMFEQPSWATGRSGDQSFWMIKNSGPTSSGENSCLF